MKKLLGYSLGLFLCFSIAGTTSVMAAATGHSHEYAMVKGDEKGTKKDKKKSECKDKKNCTKEEKEKCMGKKGGSCCHGANTTGGTTK